MNPNDFFDVNGCMFCRKHKTKKLSPLGRRMHLRILHKQKLKQMESAEEHRIVSRLKSMMGLSSGKRNL